MGQTPEIWFDTGGTILRSGDGGNSWATLLPYWGDRVGISTVTESGVAYCQFTVLTSGVYEQIIRRSSDSGATWQTVDTYGGGVFEGALTISPQGQVFATGMEFDGVDNSFYVRMSADGGQTWKQTDDSTGFPEGYHGGGTGRITTDSFGNIYSLVSATNGFYIRKLAGPPQLSCSHGGGRMLLSWPTNAATGFVLQSASTLTNGGGWQNSSLTPTITNGQNVVSVTPTSPAAFFRLRQP